MTPSPVPAVRHEQSPEPIATDSQQPLRVLDALRRHGNGPRRLTVAEAQALPALCGPDELAEIWGVSKNRISKLIRVGAFDVFRVHPSITPRQFSGELLGRHLAGESVDRSTFGSRRKRA